EVVLEHDRLAVEREGTERFVALEHVEHRVDDRAEPEPEHLERHVPLAVSMRVRDDEVAEVGDSGHADTIAPWCGSPSSSSISTAPSSTQARSSSPRCVTPRVMCSGSSIATGSSCMPLAGRGSKPR